MHSHQWAYSCLAKHIQLPVCLYSCKVLYLGRYCHQLFSTDFRSPKDKSSFYLQGILSANKSEALTQFQQKSGNVIGQLFFYFQFLYLWFKGKETKIVGVFQYLSG